MHERKREVEPALHATRVAADLAIGGVPEADARQQLVTAARPLGARQAVQGGLEAHVLAPGEERVERSLLQRSADHGAHLLALADDVVPADERGAGRRRQQGGQHVDGGGLARAVGPEEAVDLAGLDAQVDAVDRARPLLELPHQTAHFDRRFSHAAAG